MYINTYVYFPLFVFTSFTKSWSNTVEDDYENPMEFIEQKKLRKAYLSPQHRGRREECDIHRYSATASHNALSRSARERYREKSRLSKKKQERERKRRRLEEEIRGCRKIETYFPPLKTQMETTPC